MTRDEIVDLFARRAVAQADHDVDGLTALHAENCVVESPLGGTHQGRPAIRDVYRMFFDALPDAEITQDELVIDGDRVIQVVTLTATDTGGFMGLPPSGRPAELPIVLACRVAGDLIVHERRIYDFTGLLVQIGVLKAKPV